MLFSRTHIDVLFKVQNIFWLASPFHGDTFTIDSENDNRLSKAIING